MEKNSKIYIVGHTGTLGSAILTELKEQNYTNLIYKSRLELDLTNQKAVADFFKIQKPEYVFLCAAKLDTLGLFTPASVIYENSMLQANIINSAYENSVKKLIFYGSAWAYPQKANNPITEQDLLNGKLDTKAVAYGLSKIIGTKMCEAYNLQYNTNFITLYLSNLYGQTAEFDLTKAKVLPALLRKFHLAKLLNEGKFDLVLKDLNLDKNEAKKVLDKFGISKEYVEIWGSGNVVREFIHAKDLADASIFVMKNVNFDSLKSEQETHLNVGSGEFLSIKELAFLIKDIVGFNGDIKFNADKPDSTMDRMLDTSKIKSLGWKHKINLEEGVKMLYQWYKNGGGYELNLKSINNSKFTHLYSNCNFTMPFGLGLKAA
ncbi:MAG: NAD-dependent epimerase/dehydratase family protein [Campylobacter lanienae]|uniref:NAD-dependent epimerase/dehydratase family protein n=1 Tax=Campylobacter lanienae TaxID=75658 RepID=UPI00242CD4BC|nr:NAD-dependent epimerase/dehydratase family protein [Campylobacter lanienae]MCI5538968.1 NAD-dependent epimerase/dehydratase family protein [Campylobacter lanienae]